MYDVKVRVWQRFRILNAEGNGRVAYGVFARHVSVKHIGYVPWHMRYKTSATVRLTVSLQRLLVEYYYKFTTAKFIILIVRVCTERSAQRNKFNSTPVPGYQKRLSGTITKNSIL